MVGNLQCQYTPGKVFMRKPHVHVPHTHPGHGGEDFDLQLAESDAFSMARAGTRTIL